jgi:hypothetical protein
MSHRRARRYRTPEAAILDDQDPDAIPVGQIRLTTPQHRRLADLTDGHWHRYSRPLTPYDTLADWAFIAGRSQTCQITERGRRWLAQAPPIQTTEARSSA